MNISSLKKGFNKFNSSKIKFPIVTTIYFLFVLISNIVIKKEENDSHSNENTNNTNNSLPKYYKKLSDKNCAFLIPLFQDFGCTLMLNPVNTISVVYAFIAILVYSSIIEFKMGHISLFFFIFLAFISTRYREVTNILLKYKKNFDSGYFGSKKNPIRLLFNFYQCCGSNIYTNLLGCLLVCLIMKSKNKYFKIFYILLIFIVSVILIIFDYYDLKKKMNHNENYKLFVAALGFHNMMFGLGIITTLLFFFSKK